MDRQTSNGVVNGGPTIAIGIGCRRGTSGEAILSVIAAALAAIGETRPPRCLATAAFKHDEAGIADAARHLGVPLRFFDEAVLGAAGHATSPAPVVRRHVGVGAVAVPAALAAAGSGARLLAPRTVTAGITCAIAEQGASA